MLQAQVTEGGPGRMYGGMGAGKDLHPHLGTLARQSHRREQLLKEFTPTPTPT